MGSGDDMRVALIGCCGQKLDYPAPARMLYRSPLFRMAVGYAESHEMQWAVLSAQHGLVMPDRVLEPYDATFAGMKYVKADKSRWSQMVQLDIRHHWDVERVEFVLLAGEDYRGCVAHHHVAYTSPRIRFSEPLARMSVGQRLSWLKNNSKKGPPDAPPADDPDLMEHGEDIMAKKTNDTTTDDASATLPERAGSKSTVVARRPDGEREVGSNALHLLAEIADLGLDTVVANDQQSGRLIGEVLGARPLLKLAVGQSVPIAILGAKVGEGDRSNFLVLNVGLCDPRDGWKTAEEASKKVRAELDFFVGKVLREEMLSIAVAMGAIDVAAARTCFDEKEEAALATGWQPKPFAKRNAWVGRLTLLKLSPGKGNQETAVYAFELYR